jgi:hypothetical protein
MKKVVYIAVVSVLVVSNLVLESNAMAPMPGKISIKDRARLFQERSSVQQHDASHPPSTPAKDGNAQSVASLAKSYETQQPWQQSTPRPDHSAAVQDVLSVRGRAKQLADKLSPNLAPKKNPLLAIFEPYWGENDSELGLPNTTAMFLWRKNTQGAKVFEPVFTIQELQADYPLFTGYDMLGGCRRKVFENLAVILRATMLDIALPQDIILKDEMHAVAEEVVYHVNYYRDVNFVCVLRWLCERLAIPVKQLGDTPAAQAKARRLYDDVLAELRPVAIKYIDRWLLQHNAPLYSHVLDACQTGRCSKQLLEKMAEFQLLFPFVNVFSRVFPLDVAIYKSRHYFRVDEFGRPIDVACGAPPPTQEKLAQLYQQSKGHYSKSVARVESCGSSVEECNAFSSVIPTLPPAVAVIAQRDFEDVDRSGIRARALWTPETPLRR